MTKILVPIKNVKPTLNSVSEYVKQFQDIRYEMIAANLHTVLEEHMIDSGSFGTVYSLGDYVIKVMHPLDDFEDVTYRIPTAHDEGKILLDLQTLDIFPRLYYFDYNVIIMEKIEGKLLWTLKKAVVDAIPREQWYNLIDQLINVTKLGYRPIDVSTSNVLWDEQKGVFRIIDVGLYQPKVGIKKLHTMKFFSFHLFNQLYEELHWDYQFDEDYSEPQF